MKWASVWLSLMLLAALPASDNFKLNSYGFGSGGTADSGSTNYRVNGISGEVSGKASSTHYKVRAGENFEKEANVPIVSLTNDDYWYNKLHLVLDPQNNPTDAVYAVAISSDDFVTTEYIKSDLTIGSTLTWSDYLSYPAWGGAAGVMIRGLHHGTVYSVKAKAYRGKFTESPYGPALYGPASTVSTDDPTLSFDIDVAPTDISTNPPYQIDLGNLTSGSVVTSSDRIWLSIATNADSGSKVYLSGQNGGLESGTAGYTISSATGDIGSQLEGFGAQGASYTQTSGGPLTLVSPYNGSGQNIGIDDTVLRELFTTAGPVTGGRGSFILKAKSKVQTPASVDYSEVLTVVAAGDF